jgi:hypothetical protein
MVEAIIPTQANPNVVAQAATNNVQANKEMMHIFDDVEVVGDVLIVGLSKKEQLSNIMLIGQ